jgi:hypothetical protein
VGILSQIAAHMEWVGLGFVSTDTVVGNIFVGVMPGMPDTCITVYATDAAYPGAEDGARIQIVVRGPNTSVAFPIAQNIVEELVDYNGFLSGDGYRATIELINGAAGIGADERARELYSINLRVYYCET